LGLDALLIVDFQNDFTPGGALAVAGGDEIAGPLNRLVDRFEFVVATRDWHPSDNGSFQGAEVDAHNWHGTDPPAFWPVHCVQGTHGAELHASLDRDQVDIVIDKGRERWSQGYSAFQDTSLADLLHEGGVERVYVGGLATDYCVKHTVLDARDLGLGVVVIEDAIRGVDVEPGDSAHAIAEMRSAGAAFATSDETERART
jgi:nicotinamidase/pyrazinamidase